VLFIKQAQNPDELTIVENEQLEVVGEGDGMKFNQHDYKTTCYLSLIFPCLSLKQVMDGCEPEIIVVKKDLFHIII
jgi:hypothetical protein